MQSGICTLFSCINSLTVLVLFFLVGIMELALSESFECLLLIFPFTWTTGEQVRFEDPFSSSEQEDDPFDVSKVYTIS